MIGWTAKTAVEGHSELMAWTFLALDLVSPSNLGQLAKVHKQEEVVVEGGVGPGQVEPQQGRGGGSHRNHWSPILEKVFEENRSCVGDYHV